MDATFMNSENSKTSKYHVLMLKFTDKIDLPGRGCKKTIDLSDLSIYYTSKNIKNYTTIINLKYQLQHGMMNLNYHMDHT